MSTTQSINIIEDAEGELRVSSLIISGRTENQHASVLRVIREHQAELEQFGLVGFEIAPRSAGQHGGGDTTYALLNEPQSTLLMTFMRNSPVVVAFKVELVKQFYAMRQALAAPRALTPDEIVHQALQITAAKVQQLEAKVEADAPKVAYVDQFVARDDCRTIGDFAKSIGVAEKAVREELLSRGWIYKKLIGERFSAKEQRKVEEWEYRGSADHKEKFRLFAQHNAPRHHNNQLRQTLYVTPYGCERIARLFGSSEKPHLVAVNS